MNLTIKTLATYNNAASELAAKFEKMWPNLELITESFRLVNVPNPKVLEVGFWWGKDAKEIIKISSDYMGIDYSSEMVTLARRRLPEAVFLCANILEWETEEKFDVVFAFASLVHLDRGGMKKAFGKISTLLKSKSLFTFTLKHWTHQEEISEDDCGIRVFYRYDQNLLKEILGADFDIIFCDVIVLNNREWIDIICRKI